MNLRHKRRNSHLDSMEPNFQPVIGVLNNMATLNCHIQPQNHHFNIRFMNPLKIIDKIILTFQKQAFDRIVSATFDIKIKQKTKFLPEALLNGDYEVMHQYKKIIEQSRIGSYIKLNIKHQQKSYEKKKPVSLDFKTKQQGQKQVKKIFGKNFNEKTVNEKSSKKFNHYLTVNNTLIHQESKSNSTFTPVKQNRSFTVSKSSQINKKNEQNVNIHRKIEEHREIRTANQTQLHNVKKTLSTKKSRGIDGIKINYIAIKGCQENPQTSTFIYKSTRSRTNRQRSEFGTKTQFISPHMIHFDKTLQNDISFSVHNEDKFSICSQLKKNNDNLSEQFQKSLKDSQASQLTHNEIYTNDYFANDRKILKKGRKSVYIENFQRKQIL